MTPCTTLPPASDGCCLRSAASTEGEVAVTCIVTDSGNPRNMSVCILWIIESSLKLDKLEKRSLSSWKVLAGHFVICCRRWWLLFELELNEPWRPVLPTFPDQTNQTLWFHQASGSRLPPACLIWGKHVQAEAAVDGVIALLAPKQHFRFCPVFVPDAQVTAALHTKEMLLSFMRILPMRHLTSVECWIKTCPGWQGFLLSRTNWQPDKTLLRDGNGSL